MLSKDWTPMLDKELNIIGLQHASGIALECSTGVIRAYMCHAVHVPHVYYLGAHRIIHTCDYNAMERMARNMDRFLFTCDRCVRALICPAYGDVLATYYGANDAKLVALYSGEPICRHRTRSYHPAGPSSSTRR